MQPYHKVIDAIASDKDVDGFYVEVLPWSPRRLASPGLVPCTPLLLDAAEDTAATQRRIV